jgi:signal peptidase II
VRTARYRIAVLILAALATIGCDRVTKFAATSQLAGTPGRSYFLDTIRLQYAENEGGFLSIGASLPSTARTWIFTVATGFMFLAIIPMARQYRGHLWPLLGLTLLAAGGLSNWVDRVMSGHVVDFLNIGVGPIRTGIFNVADVALMIGGLLLVVLKRPRRPAEIATSPAE